jgi:hypothetical protein
MSKKFVSCLHDASHASAIKLDYSQDYKYVPNNSGTWYCIKGIYYRRSSKLSRRHRLDIQLGWTDTKCIDTVGGKISWKASIWKTIRNGRMILRWILWELVGRNRVWIEIAMTDLLPVCKLRVPCQLITYFIQYSRCLFYLSNYMLLHQQTAHKRRKFNDIIKSLG